MRSNRRFDSCTEPSVATTQMQRFRKTKMQRTIWTVAGLLVVAILLWPQTGEPQPLCKICALSTRGIQLILAQCDVICALCTAAHCASIDERIYTGYTNVGYCVRLTHQTGWIGCGCQMTAGTA
jgi:hypothetical protein